MVLVAHHRIGYNEHIFAMLCGFWPLGGANSRAASLAEGAVPGWSCLWCGSYGAAGRAGPPLRMADMTEELCGSRWLGPAASAAILAGCWRGLGTMSPSWHVAPICGRSVLAVC